MSNLSINRRSGLGASSAVAALALEGDIMILSRYVKRDKLCTDFGCDGLGNILVQ